ncbi:MAG: endolytic transglycosylase MltG [Sphingobium sp.]|nr:endolytic transglycosylase MltG [Sphingobium sp.]
MRRVGCAIIVILALVCAGVAWNFVRGWTEDGPAPRDTAIVIPEGATLTKAALELKQAGLIRSADAFLTRAKLLGGGGAIKAGEYLIPKGASNKAILAILQGGVAIRRLITVPEGMPSILVYEKLMAAKELTGPLSMPAEGSILPDSYAFERGETRAAVLDRMQKAMAAELTKAWGERSRDTVVTTPQQAIILASIVEKETGKPSERAMVAGVYSNRLRAGIMLQADPTIIYPITKGKPLGRRIKKSEIAARNDYNTYAMTGLPRGPIANPGRDSIRAVLNPAKTKALYFVADGTGGHVFAETLEQHNENVRKWFEIRRARGEL